MIRRLIIPVLALAGIGYAVFAVIHNQQGGAEELPATKVGSALPAIPFTSYVAGIGIIEANTTEIPIGSPVSGVVTQVYVQSGDELKAGDPLFVLDCRVQQQAVNIARAEVSLAQARLAAVDFELQLARELRESRTISRADAERRELEKVVAGAELNRARAALQAAETERERLTVRAPMDGRVLQLGVHPGQFALEGQAPGHKQPLVLFGNVEPLHLRVAVDEAEAWRLQEGAKGLAFLHANPSIQFSLSFVRIEPALVAKISLTGRSTERVDSRVLQVLYRFDKSNAPVYVGQQMDVYLEAEKRP